jgi:hypothetical protein
MPCTGLSSRGRCRTLFASGRSLPEDFVATFTTGFVAAPEGPISLLPTQLAALTPAGQVFSNPTAIPVGFGIRRAGAAENLPVGVYDDYRAVLSFPIPASIPANAVVQRAQLTLVQLPSNDSATIPGFGDRGRGFFFLDPTPHNLPSNNVVFQEVTLGAPNNVVSSDFFAPASTPTLVALSINGNVLGGDVSAGPRTADVGPGVQRSVSAPGPRFYQVRLQCAKEVWNNQATSEFPSLSTSVSSSAGGTASGAPAVPRGGSHSRLWLQEPQQPSATLPTKLPLYQPSHCYDYAAGHQPHHGELQCGGQHLLGLLAHQCHDDHPKLWPAG